MSGSQSACSLEVEYLTDFTGDVYYRYSSDSSFMTWFTDAVWCVEMWYLASLMWKKDMSFVKDRARIYGIGCTVVIGFAAFWGFVHHGLCPSNKQDCFLQTWGSCCVSIMSSGAMAILSGVYMLTRNRVYVVTMALEACLLSFFTYLGLLNYFEMKPFIIVGLFGNVFPQVLLFLCICILYGFGGSMGVKLGARSLVNYLIGFTIHMVGVAVSLKCSALCSTSCPVDCPLPVPHFNHNAITHLTEMLGAIPIAWASVEVHNALESRELKPKKL